MKIIFTTYRRKIQVTGTCCAHPSLHDVLNILACSVNTVGASAPAVKSGSVTGAEKQKIQILGVVKHFSMEIIIQKELDYVKWRKGVQGASQHTTQLRDHAHSLDYCTASA